MSTTGLKSVLPANRSEAGQVDITIIYIEGITIVGNGVVSMDIIEISTGALVHNSGNVHLIFNI